MEKQRRKVSAAVPFEHVVEYPTCEVEEDVIYELVDFGNENKEKVIWLKNMLGVMTPAEITFEVKSPTLLYAKALYIECFEIEVFVDTKEFSVEKDKDEKIFSRGCQKPLFLSRKKTERYKKILHSKTVFTISNSAKTKYTETEILKTEVFLSDILISFWMDKPGYTDGPDAGSGPEEILSFLKKNK